MPVTYNGIGTRYVGEKNVQTRPGTCQQCHREVQLRSYDTRLFFVVLFIPIIPLKRMRILDYCPSCTRHYAMEASKWETAKQLEVSGALDRFRSDPTPENGISVHQQLLNFHLIDQAQEFRQSLTEKFPDNAKVQAYLGASLVHLGKPEEAVVHYQRALALRPDLPEARIGVAQDLVRNGKLDEARQLLDFLEKPGASQLYQLEPLNQLAQGYQRAQRHEDALKLFEILQKELPSLGELDWFRKLVKQSEKATGRADSQLPKTKISLKRFLTLGGPSGARTATILAVAFALVALGFVVSNEYIRRHRVLHLVNGFPTMATVKIAAIGEFKVNPGFTPITLPEGRYHATIVGPVHEELELDVTSSYFDRWFEDPAWILNLGGEAIVVRTAATYSQNPPPPRIDFLFGRSFQKLEGITHPFKDLPKQVQLKKHETRTLTQLDLLNGSPLDVLNYYHQKKDLPRSLNFSEQWLSGHDNDAAMFQWYVNDGSLSGETNRVLEFLRVGAEARPVKIEWHRAYQTALHWTADAPKIQSIYQHYLEAEPTNAALLYLRGRVETDRPTALTFYERSAAADPQSPYPLFALGYERLSHGDWPRARELLEQVHNQRPRDRGYESYLTSARLALGQASDIEKEARERLASRATDFYEAGRLVNALAVQGKKDAVAQVCEDFSRANRAHYGNDGRLASDSLWCSAAYALGDLKEWERVLDTAQPRVAEPIKAQFLIESGKLSEAKDALKTSAKQGRLSALETLALAIAYHRAGDPAESDRILAAKAAELDLIDQDLRRAYELLMRAQPPRASEIQELTLPLQLKPIVLVGLGTKHPELQKNLFAMARQLNIEHEFPHLFVKKITTPADQGRQP